MIKPYVKVFVCEKTGIKSTYTYNGASIVNGMIKAEFEYPKQYLDDFAKKEKIKNNLPKTKQKFLNPATGKEVGYYRAKNLGLVK